MMNLEKFKTQFSDFVIDNDIIGIFESPIQLKSGRESYWYVNWRNIASDVYLMDFLTDFVIEFTEILNLKPDCFFGVPEGATKLGVLTQFKWAKNQEDYKKYGYRLAMGRGKPKEHGAEKDKHYLGVPKGKVIVLEDVTTTGGSLIQTLNNLIELDVDIIAAISLTNRNEIRDDGSTVEDLIDKLSVKYYSMSQALELLPQLFIRNNIDEYITKKIQAYFKKYGQKELILK